MNSILKKVFKFYKSESERKNLIKYLIISFLIGGVLNGLMVTPMLKSAGKISDTTMNPFLLFYYGVFKCGASYYAFLVALTLIVAAIFLAIHYKRVTNLAGEEADDKLSKESTELGKHHIATREEQDEVLTSQNVKDAKDNIIGWRGILSETNPLQNEKTAKKNCLTIKDGYNNRKIGPHWFLVGPPGRGKSSNFFVGNIIQMIDRGESVIMTDPKGELWELTHIYAEKHGAKVKVLNLIDLVLSDGVNFLDYCHNNADCRMCRTVIMRGLQEKSGKADFWEKGEGEWILCIMLYLVETKEVGNPERSLQGIHNFTLDNSIEEISEMMEELPPSSIAKAVWREFKDSDVRINDSFKLGVAGKLGIFNDPIVIHATSVSGDIDLTLPIKEQCVYYVLMSDTDSSNDFIANLFFSILFTTNIKYADLHKHTRVPINFILEEFCNIGEIPDIRKKLATIRSRGMRCIICIQGFQQLEDTYDCKIGGFLDQVDNIIVFGMNDPKMAKEVIQARAGKGTLVLHQRSVVEHTFMPVEIHSEYGDRTTATQKDVLDVADITGLNFDKFILMLPGEIEVMILNKFYWKWHPKADELVEENYMFHTPNWWKTVLDDKKLTKEEKELLVKELERIKKEREILREEEKKAKEKKVQSKIATDYDDVEEVTLKTLWSSVKNKVNTDKPEEEKKIVDTPDDEIEEVIDNLTESEKAAPEVEIEEVEEERQEDNLAEQLMQYKEQERKQIRKNQKFKKKSNL